MQTNQTGFLSKINGDLRSAALMYAEEGFSIIPLHFLTKSGSCSCGKSDCSSPAKHPLTQHGLIDASKDPKQIEAWWQRFPKANIGICTGAVSGGLVVVDVDVIKGGSADNLGLPETAKVETGNGFHLYFHSDQAIRNSAGRLGQAIDVRGDGGYVVAPPSVHYTGKSYSFVSTSDIAEFPASLFSILNPPAQQPAIPDQQPDDIIVSDETAIDSQVGSGQRNQFLTSWGGRLRSFGLGQAEIEASLRAVNLQRCKPPLNDKEVVQIAKSVARYSPSAAAQIDKQIEEPPEVQPASTVNKNVNVQTSHSSQRETFGLNILTAGELDLTLFEDGEQLLWWLYPGELAQMNALPDAGKSTLCLNLALSLACGRPFEPLVKEQSPKRVLYLDFENRWSRYKNDLATMRRALTPAQDALVQENFHSGLDLEVNGLPFVLTEKPSIQALVKYLKHYKNALVIVDTLSQAAQIGDENSNAEMQRKVISPLKRVAQITDSAILLIHHKGKAGENDDKSRTQYEGRGASSLPGASRLILDLKPSGNDDGVVTLRCAKVKGPKFPPISYQLDPVSRWYFQLAAPVIPPPEDVIVETLEAATEELSVKDLEALIPDMPRRTLERKLLELTKAKRVIRTKRGVYRSAWDGEPEPGPTPDPPTTPTAA